MAKVVGIADSDPPDHGITADQWTREFIARLRLSFKRAGWPLPSPRGGGANGVRARADSNLPKHYKVDPHIEQSDRMFIIRFPSTELTDEAICRQIIMGLIHVAYADLRIRSGAPYESTLMDKGQLYQTIRARCLLLDHKDNLTRHAISIITQLVAKTGSFPEGSSNRRPKTRKHDSVDLQCQECGVMWIPHYPRGRHEDVRALGGFRCPQRSCGGILVDSNEIGELYRFKRS